ncbi:MAG: hypothetical protein HYX85_00285 [Chloroflexi bacterium]|nr:hypothetical protein [Chloroflexota bacterium]
MSENAGSTSLAIDGALAALGRRLQSAGLRSLRTLIARIEESEQYDDFVRIVREFLPEREQEILREPTPWKQISTFAGFFEDRYFPLDAGYGDASYADFIGRGVPVEVHGIGWEQYEEAPQNWAPQYQLIAYLVESPLTEDGARIAIGEALLDYVPKKLLKKVPDKGFPLETLKERLKDTRYWGVALFVGRIHQSAGNFYLDTDDEMLWSGGDLPEWTKEDIDWLTNQWQQAQLIMQEADRSAEWLEQDMPAHFKELLDVLFWDESKT